MVNAMLSLSQSPVTSSNESNLDRKVRNAAKGRVVLLSVATTGDDPTRHRIVKAGVALMENGVVDETTSTEFFLKTPYDPVVWDCCCGPYHPNNGFLLELLASQGLLTESLLARIAANGGSVLGIRGVPDHLAYLRNGMGELIFATARDRMGVSPLHTELAGMERLRAIENLGAILTRAADKGYIISGFDPMKTIAFVAHEWQSLSGSVLKVSNNNVVDAAEIAAIRTAKPLDIRSVSQRRSGESRQSPVRPSMFKTIRDCQRLGVAKWDELSPSSWRLSTLTQCRIAARLIRKRTVSYPR